MFWTRWFVFGAPRNDGPPLHNLLMSHVRIPPVALFIFCLMLGATPLAAQTDFNVRLWQAEDGLPNNIVQSIAQTRDGYLWLGTREGLAQFDGNQFRTVNLVPHSSQPSISCLFASRDGDLWIGTENFGIFCLSNGKLTRRDVEHGNYAFDVDQIQEAADGSVWFSTTHGVLRWANQKMERMAAFANHEPKLAADANGGIWALDGNLKRIDSLVTTNLPLLSGSIPRIARSLYCDGNGTFWIGTDFGVENALIKVEDGVVHTFRRGAGPGGFVSVIFRDSYGNVWVGSYSGLSRFENGKFLNFHAADNLSYRIYAIFEDREHNIWVGSEEGLTRLTPKRFKTISKETGLSLNTVVSVCPSRDGGVWIGTWGGGLDHYLDGEISYLTESNGLKSNFVMGMMESHDGKLWAGTDYGGPLSCIEDGHVTVYGREQGFVPGMATVTVFESSADVLWIGTRGGLNMYDGQKFAHFTTKDGLCNNWVNAICEGTNGDIWIGTSDGMTRWADGKFENLSAKDPRLHVQILSLYEDGETLWIGTKRHGLYGLRGEKLLQLTRESGLFSDAIYSILEDNHTNLWLNSSRGIFRVNKQQVESYAEGHDTSIISISYGRADGILSSGQYREVTQPAACKDTRGRIWFRTTQGVVMADPEAMAMNHQPPPCMIEEILADNKRLAVNDVGGEIARHLDIAPGRGDLEIHYAALSYTDPGKNLYRYKLDGADPDWVNAGNSGVAKYSHLRPGPYTFQVIACNNDGVWNDKGQSVEFMLEPHFWQTWWFLSLCGVVAAGIIGGSARYITRMRMRQEMIRLEQQHAVERERARIARDVHDELGTRLTQISFQGSIAKVSVDDPAETRRYIEQMSSSARDAVSSLQEIIWAADPENDSLEGLVGHVSQYAGEFFSASTIHWEVVTPEHMADRRISAAARHNLFMAIKEAINNAVKHASATRVLIRFSIQVNNLEILISDNGGGFDGAHAAVSGDKSRRVGHGLINMQERLKMVGGHCEINSGAGQGTTISFVLPLAD